MTEKKKKTVTVEATGSYVFKESIRQVIGVDYNGWSKEIDYLTKNDQSFAQKYLPFKRKRRVPASIAQTIIQTIYSEMGYDIVIEYSFATSAK